MGRVRKAGCTLVVMLAGVGAPVAAAQGATRVVDNDGRQCPSAGFRSIQAAVEASGPRDTVRVCAGFYRERVVVHSGKNGLVLRSAAPQAAVVKAPRHSRPIIEVWSRDVLVTGFKLTGPWPVPPRCSMVHMYEEAGVVIQNGASATVTDNFMTELYQAGCRRWGMGVRTTFKGGLCSEATEGHISDNHIERFGAGGVVGYCGETVVEDNVIVGDPALESRDGVYMYYWAEGEVVGNDISRADRGIRLEGYEPGGLVAGNQVHDNRIGIYVVKDAFPWTVRGNVLLRNRAAGLLTESSGSDFVDNRSTGSRLDCGDYGSGNTWTGNFGVTANKPGLCRRP